MDIQADPIDAAMDTPLPGAGMLTAMAQMTAGVAGSVAGSASPVAAERAPAR